MNRRNVLGSLLVALSAEGAESRLPDRLFTLAEGKTATESFGTVTIYAQAPTEQLSSLVTGSCMLHPGQQPHPPHQHPEEEIMLITEGTGQIRTGGEWAAVSPGSLMFCEGNHEHGIRNTGTVPMRFFYAKWSARK
jgi:mannose-6-phosphate isomerase-like protein (cupin superfamily)